MPLWCHCDVSLTCACVCARRCLISLWRAGWRTSTKRRRVNSRKPEKSSNSYWRRQRSPAGITHSLFIAALSNLTWVHLLTWTSRRLSTRQITVRLKLCVVKRFMSQKTDRNQIFKTTHGSIIISGVSARRKYSVHLILTGLLCLQKCTDFRSVIDWFDHLVLVDFTNTERCWSHSSTKCLRTGWRGIWMRRCDD